MADWEDGYTYEQYEREQERLEKLKRKREIEERKEDECTTNN